MGTWHKLSVQLAGFGGSGVNCRGTSGNSSLCTKEKSCYICKRNHLHSVNICFCSSYLLSYRNWRQSIKCTESPSLAFCFVCVLMLDHSSHKHLTTGRFSHVKYVKVLLFLKKNHALCNPPFSLGGVR